MAAVARGSARRRRRASVALADGGGRLAVLTLHGDLYVWDTRSLVAAAAAGDAPAAAAAAAAPPRVPPLPMVVASGTGGARWLSAYWWDGRPDALVLACRSGAVSVSALPGGQQLPPRRVATDELRNLLGAQPEVFASRALLSAASAGRFFVLEREATIVRAAANAAAAPAAAPPRVGAAGGARGRRAGGGGVASRLIVENVTSTTLRAEDCGQRVRRRAAVGGALWDLGADPVRIAQWRDADVSRTSIRDFLHKVSSLAVGARRVLPPLTDDDASMEILLEYMMGRVSTWRLLHDSARAHLPLIP